MDMMLFLELVLADIVLPVEAVEVSTEEDEETVEEEVPHMFLVFLLVYLKLLLV